MLVLDREVTCEVEDYFFDSGCNITFTDGSLLPEMLFVETELTEVELRGLMYVEEVRAPHGGLV